jgi:hypothetical protein
MRGAVDSTSPPALLLIDMQQRAALGTRMNLNAEQQIASLLAAWCLAKWAVIHVQYMAKRSAVFSIHFVGVG